MSYPQLVDPDRTKDWARQVVVQLERDFEEARARFGLIFKPAINTNAVVVDLAKGDTCWITLDQDLTTWTILSPRATDRQRFDYRVGLEQDGTGGRAVTWPTEWEWGAAGAPTITAAAGAKDIIDLTVIDGITYARVFGQGF